MTRAATNNNLFKRTKNQRVMDPDTFVYELKIPKDRIAVLIGVNGETKSDLQAATKALISIDSKEGDITISGKDSLGLFSAKEIVTAIGRGFNPDIAKLLLKGDYGIAVISIADYAKTKNDLIRLRGRLIGENGRARRVLEELTQTNLSVYGKTASLIGRHLWVELARRAVEALLEGANHAGVYHALEKKRKALKRKEVFEDVSEDRFPVSKSADGKKKEDDDE